MWGSEGAGGLTNGHTNEAAENAAFTPDRPSKNGANWSAHCPRGHPSRRHIRCFTHSPPGSR